MMKKIENKNATKKLLRNIKLDYVGTFLANLNMQSCIWVLYLLYCGLNLAQVGFLEGIYHATSIVCEIPSGRFVRAKEKHGFRQNMYCTFLYDYAFDKKFLALCPKLYDSGHGQQF